MTPSILISQKVTDLFEILMPSFFQKYAKNESVNFPQKSMKEYLFIKHEV